MFEKYNMNKLQTMSMLFDDEPKQWGLRGDPYLWKEMKKYFYTISIPGTSTEVKNLIESAFENITMKSITEDKSFFLERFSFGGMSSGGISPDFWRDKAIPLIVSKHKDMTNKST